MMLPPFQPIARHFFDPATFGCQPGVFDPEQSLLFQRIADGVMGNSWFAVEEVGDDHCHSLGCAGATAKNHRKYGENDPDPRMDYLGYYTVPRVCIDTLHSDLYTLKTVRAPENDEFSHFHLELHEKAAEKNPSKGELRLERTSITNSISKMLIGPYLMEGHRYSKIAWEKAQSLPVGPATAPKSPTGIPVVGEACLRCFA